MSEPSKEILGRAAAIARGLALDAVHSSQSGHLGLPLGCAEIGAVLYGQVLNHCPAHPEWLNRDRFILSAGHGSMFLYAWLHLSGYAEMTMAEVRRFRQLGVLRTYARMWRVSLAYQAGVAPEELKRIYERK